MNTTQAGRLSEDTLAADPTDGWGAQLGNVVAVPEPATLLVLGAGMIGLGLRRRFKAA